MATRVFKGPAVYGEAASTDTSSPSTGTGYRDTTITDAQIQAALKKFDTLAGSAIENEYLFRLSKLIDLIERTGILGWNAETNYITNARVIADNGIEYRALSASLNADPMTSPALWQEVRPQLAVGETLFLTVDLTPTQLGYVGTWVSIEAGASLGAVDPGDPAIGTVTGDNTPPVPLLQHTHTATFAGNPLPSTSFDLTGFVAPVAPGSTQNSYEVSGGTNWSLGRTLQTAAKSPGTPTGTVTVDAEGQPPGTFSVQGKVLNGVWWKRTA